MAFSLTLSQSHCPASPKRRSAEAQPRYGTGHSPIAICHRNDSTTAPMTRMVTIPDAPMRRRLDAALAFFDRFPVVVVRMGLAICCRLCVSTGFSVIPEWA